MGGERAAPSGARRLTAIAATALAREGYKPRARRRRPLRPKGAGVKFKCACGEARCSATLNAPTPSRPHERAPPLAAAPPLRRFVSGSPGLLLCRHHPMPRWKACSLVGASTGHAERSIGETRLRASTSDARARASRTSHPPRGKAAAARQRRSARAHLSRRRPALQEGATRTPRRSGRRSASERISTQPPSAPPVGLRTNSTSCVTVWCYVRSSCTPLRVGTNTPQMQARTGCYFLAETQG